MTLDEIPDGARVLADVNVLIYARRGVSAQCHRLLERGAAGAVSVVIATIALAEFCHRRMMQEAQSLGLVASNPAKALANNPEQVRQLRRYSRDVEDLLAGSITLLPLEGADFGRALELQRQCGLMTNDSLQLAAGLRAGVTAIATSDPQFDAVAGLTVYRPDDIP